MAASSIVRVLVIDDDPDFVILIRDLLSDASRSDFVIEGAATIQGGLDFLDKTSFDVILLDYKLPDGTGLDFLERLDGLHIKVPVVIVTSRGDKTLQVQALDAGAVDYLSKGNLSTDLLERTCIYAIGIQEKRNGGGPGVGILIEQMVELTRDSVKAQTESASETREMRRELSEGIAAIKQEMLASQERTERVLKENRNHCQTEHDRVVGELQSLSGIRWILDWIKKNRFLSIMIFVCLVLTVVLVVVLFNYVDTSKIKDIMSVTSPTSYLMDDVWIG